MLVLFHKIVREQFKLGALTDVYYNLQNEEFVNDTIISST